MGARTGFAETVSPKKSSRGTKKYFATAKLAECERSSLCSYYCSPTSRSKPFALSRSCLHQRGWLQTPFLFPALKAQTPLLSLEIAPASAWAPRSERTASLAELQPSALICPLRTALSPAHESTTSQLSFRPHRKRDMRSSSSKWAQTTSSGLRLRRTLPSGSNRFCSQQLLALIGSYSFQLAMLAARTCSRSCCDSSTTTSRVAITPNSREQLRERV